LQENGSDVFPKIPGFDSEDSKHPDAEEQSTHSARDSSKNVKYFSITFIQTFREPFLLIR